MPKVRILVSVLLLASLAVLPHALRADENSERGWRELDKGNRSKALWLFEQALNQDPCDASSQQGYAKAGGDAMSFAKLCGQADASHGSEAAPASEPTAEATPLPSKAEQEAEAKEAQQMAAAEDAKPAAPAAESQTRVAVKAALKSVLLFGLGVVVLGGIVLAAFFLARRRPAAKAPAKAAVPDVKVPPSLVKLVAQHDAAAAQAAQSAPQDSSPSVDDFLAEAAPAPLAVPAPPAPKPEAPRPLPAVEAPLPSPEGVSDVLALKSKPFGPHESVKMALRAGGEEIFLTDKKLYWTGTRALQGSFGNKPAPITTAVPFGQISGFAWAKPKGGDVLIIGTVLAGDISLRASLFGTAALQSFAQALSESLDRES